MTCQHKRKSGGQASQNQRQVRQVATAVLRMRLLGRRHRGTAR
eukprot:CAMPEP_0205861202 /NCGR_PEP_ID=MMETSP1083-20121108/5641_1 /ASSEMBLY_ACC=CAM_ASM_000430 /TAXON_ID=97485 /ORGANISM="Prymnesium parvum, Strain Texoma1" /LENGTH=42 /DNA_ID= /DNA_START= /DNA_END= /DNA_ORIENTATION=